MVSAGKWKSKVFSELKTGGPALDFGFRDDLSKEVIFKLSFRSANRASLVAQLVKNLPTIWETWVQSLGWEDPLEKGMATHFSFLAWRTPWTEEPGGLQSMGLLRVRHDWATFTFNNVVFWFTSVHTSSYYKYIFIPIVIVIQLLSHVWFFATPWNTAC